MFSKIKNFFVYFYETMKRKIIGTYVKVNNWLVDTLTGEIVDNSLEPTSFIGAIKQALLLTFCSLKAKEPGRIVLQNVMVAFLNIIKVGILSMVTGGVFYLFGDSFLLITMQAFLLHFLLDFLAALYLSIMSTDRLSRIVGRTTILTS